jgi:CRISPR-associated protein Csx14
MATLLIAALGGQPQIVTFTLDLLLRRGESIEGVYTVFPGGNGRYIAAHRKLEAEFAKEPYRHRGIRYHAHSLTALQGRPLLDIRDEATLDRVWKEISMLIGEMRQRGHQLHISLTGGRRAIALMLFSAAMLYCTTNDRIWHIYTQPQVLAKVKNGARMHVAPEEGVRLLSVPFAPWGAYFPGIKAILGLGPQQILALQSQWADEATYRRCHQVWERLSAKQKEVLKALVTHPTRRAAAEALNLALSTVDTHREAIIATCREVWPEEKVDLRFVRRVFQGFFLRAAP